MRTLELAALGLGWHSTVGLPSSSLATIFHSLVIAQAFGDTLLLPLLVNSTVGWVNLYLCLCVACHPWCLGQFATVGPHILWFALYYAIASRLLSFLGHSFRLWLLLLQCLCHHDLCLDNSSICHLPKKSSHKCHRSRNTFRTCLASMLHCLSKLG